MSTESGIFGSLRSIHLLFHIFVIIVFLLVLTANTRAGFLYVLNEHTSSNQIYGYSVNDTNGALTSLAGFPIATGGTGLSATLTTDRMTLDRLHRRLYVINDGSDTISAFSIDSNTGALTPLPFSPITLPSGPWSLLAVHPSGSPLLVGNSDTITPVVASFNVTATTAVAAAGSPFPSGGIRPAFSSTFSRDGNFVYFGSAGLVNTFAGFSVNSSTGVLTALPGSPFDSGAQTPTSFAPDLQGRLFTANYQQSVLRAFTTTNGLPAGVTGNPFKSNVASAGTGVLHPNENFYYVADRSISRVAAFQIAGSGAATTLNPVFPWGSAGGALTNTLVFNNSGAFLFAANANSRNIATYAVNDSTGVMTFNNVLSLNSLGTVGLLNGIAYLPTVRTVTNANDSGAGSLRQAVLDANVTGGAQINFDPAFFAAPQTISLTTGYIGIFSNITIVGTGANMLTVRNIAAPSNNSRVFTVFDAVANLSGMTISGGNLSEGNGGGIFNIEAILTLTNSAVSDNATPFVGGGLASTNGTISIINSTFSGNSSGGGGGGAIDTFGGTLIIKNSTISGNTCYAFGAGGISMQSKATIISSTITNNSATGGASGVSSSDFNTNIKNTIIAGNRNNTNVPDVAGNFNSAPLLTGYNLIGNVGDVTVFNQPGDQTGTSASPLDPKLVPVLAFKGGTVPTHVPLPNSPAVDKGTHSNILSDQRGFTRPFDNGGIPNKSDGSDIGAFERRAAESIFTAPFDFDGDGKTDLAIFRPAPGEWWYLKSSNGGNAAFQFGASTDKITPGDFTGDGKTDIAFWRPSNGFWFVLRSEDFSFYSFPFGTNGDIPAPADYDGDSKFDAAVFRPSTTTWFILRSSGGTTIEQFGASSDKPVPADYDGDGKADIAIYRPSVGQWWLNRSTAGVIVFQFGDSSDKAAPGDYTGDGKHDVAFWRPSTGEWFILRSEDSSYFSFPFGTNGDIPAPGDYDGDGKFDATVFRPSGATWFVQRTTAGTLIQGFGQNGDQPVPNAFVP